MNLRWIEMVTLAAGVAVVAFLCWLFGLGGLLAAWERLAPGYLLLYLGFGCAVRMGYSLRWRAVVGTLGGRVGLARAVSARLAGDAIGYLLPSGRIGGDPVRVGLLCQDGIGVTQASAGVAIDRIMETISNMLCAVAFVSVFALAHRVGMPHRAAVGLIVTMGVLLAALGLPLMLLRRGVRPLEPLYRIAAGWGSPRLSVWLDALRRTEGHLLRFFGDHPATFASGLVWSLVIEGLVICEYHCLLRAFGVELGLPTLLMALVASGLSRAVPTPAGLGALEAGQVTLLAVAAGQPDVGFVVGMLMRMHETLWIAVGLAVLSAQGLSMVRVRLLASAGKVP